MRLSISSAHVEDWSGDVLVVGLPKGDPTTTAVHLEGRFPGVTTALTQQAFEGKTGQQLVLNPLAKTSAPTGLPQNPRASSSPGKY